jgi:hypothetical protein
MSWATESDLLAYLGVTLSDQRHLVQANTDITVYANRSEAASASISNRDLLALKLATCYQAAWLPSQSDALGRVNIDSTTVDGESIKFASEAQQNLAPGAIRALKNLSWKGSRTLVIPSSAVPLGSSSSIDFTSESSDESSDWSEN